MFVYKSSWVSSPLMQLNSTTISFAINCAQDYFPMTQEMVSLGGITDSHNSCRLKTSEQISIISEIKEDISRAVEEQDRRKVIKWLFEADPSTEQNSADLKHEANTGSWLTASENFQNWLRSPNSLYWLNGGGRCTL